MRGRGNSPSRAFVIGNGPSLNETPVDALRDEFTIAMNRFNLLETDWDPDWWLAVDVSPKDEWDWGNLFQRDSMFVMDSHSRPLVEEHINRLDTHNVLFLDRCAHPGADWVWHLPAPCWRGGGVSLSLQLAATLGKNPIYLVGCDLYEYRPPGPDINHFHPEYSPYKIRKSTGEEVVRPKDWDRLNKRLTRAHQMAKDSAASMGISIFNATIGGMLEVYERADINAVLNGTE